MGAARRLMSRARNTALLALSALAGARAQNVYNAGPVWRYDPTVMGATSGACGAFVAREL